ncbi:hypothetical protein Y032_0213g2287 [Ancylostoma ceylanicum]|uniref:Uncharacterized protein n=1 Tax=Ancylostoma ceylanicum TaxID=53326 RepID=A0A016SJL5_9BILA|nr:hypothetical protein Y032_0213g2287 [Ancylostoma ceylanicum]
MGFLCPPFSDHKEDIAYVATFYDIPACVLEVSTGMDAMFRIHPIRRRDLLRSEFCGGFLLENLSPPKSMSAPKKGAK